MKLTGRNKADRTLRKGPNYVFHLYSLFNTYTARENSLLKLTTAGKCGRKMQMVIPPQVASINVTVSQVARML